MIIYKLECLNEDGNYEYNGYYLHKSKAESEKLILDNQKRNTKYGIIQHITEIYVDEDN